DLQRHDDGYRIRQHVALEPSRHVEHGRIAGTVAGVHAGRGGALSARADGAAARDSRRLSEIKSRYGIGATVVLSRSLWLRGSVRHLKNTYFARAAIPRMRRIATSTQNVAIAHAIPPVMF